MLQRLGEVDYEIAPGQPDVRGWDVVLGNDEQIGEVDDLIIDTSAGKVRYLEVELNRDALRLEHDRHVLVPIARAQLDRDGKEVVLRGLDRAGLLNLPEYSGTLTGGYDETFGSHLRDESPAGKRRMTLSAEEMQIQKRVERTGDVRVGKRVETEHVRQSVPVTREEVHVDRRPVEDAVGSAELRDDEVVVPISEERLEVNKRPVVKEEVVIRKERVTEQRPIEADLRREELDTTRSSERVREDVKGRGGE